MEVVLNSVDIVKIPHTIKPLKADVEILKAALIKKGVLTEAEVIAER